MSPLLPPEVYLVDHPVLPVPLPAGQGHVLAQPEPLRTAGRSRRQRLELAVQLTATAAALAELELWLGRRAVRCAGVAADGVSVRVPFLPRPLAPIVQRLGGGEEAVRRLRDAVAGEIQRVCALPASLLGHGSLAATADLGGWLGLLVQQLEGALPEPVGRSLWAVQWRLPPAPEEGEVQLWSVPHEPTAQRLAAATQTALAAAGRHAWWLTVGSGSTAALPPVDATGTVILAGAVGRDDLVALDRWTRRDGCGGVVYGSYPDGWQPPTPPGFEPDRLERHLVLVGLPPAQAQAEVESRCGRFHPLAAADRAALTAAACTVFRRRPAAGIAAGEAAVQRVLGLAPEGVPETFFLLHTGLGPEDLVRLERRGGLVRREGRCRASWARPMVPDPLHDEVALLYPPGHPRHLLHRLLGGGAPGALERWARERLDELAEDEVWALLGAVDPEALPPALVALVTEAALARQDLGSARRTLAHLPAAAQPPWSAWLQVLDAGDPLVLVEQVDVESAPRATAVVAARALGRAGGAERAAVESVLEAAVGRLAGPLRRLLEQDSALARAPELLAARAWRRRAVGAHPVLRRAWLHRRALALLRAGRGRAAATCLRRAVALETRPGALGLLLLDLGAAELMAGRSRRAELPQLRAHRLLQAAGFLHRPRHALFNLAVADLDAFRLPRAEQRFAALVDGRPDPALDVELARLDLARGDLEGVRRRLENLAGANVGLGVGETAHLLEGVLLLLEGESGRAGEHFAGAGAEGASWRALVDVLDGRPSAVSSVDGWGVAQAAHLVAASRGGAAAVRELLDASTDGPDGALTLVLAERLAGPLPGVDAARRRRARERLRAVSAAGWAEQLAPAAPTSGRFLAALACLAEEGGLDALGDGEVRALLEGLGSTGLLLRRAGGEGPVRRWGEGRAGTPVKRHDFEVVPLGGEPEGEGWRLLMALLGLLAPPPAIAPDPDAAATGLWGVSPGMGQVRRQLQELAPTRFPVTLLGETGVGKDVAAHALHRLSGRRGKLVPVNVTAIPTALLEAELFGAVRGAYTGADRPRPGLVDSAEGGTLFLDEIGDLDPLLQAKILRFLESGEVRPVGSVTPRQVDVRVVTATHHDLRAEVADGRFRRDLFYRVASGLVLIPPLRERREDVPVLRQLFESRTVGRDGILPAAWSRRAEAAMEAYAWPGNVRELLHVVQIALLRARGGVVQRSHLPLAEDTAPPAVGRWDEAIAERRRQLLSGALEANGGNRSAAARELGISRQTLHHHLRELNLDGGKKRADRAVRGKKEEV